MMFDIYLNTVQIIRPPMVLVENGLNSEQVSLMRHIENGILVLKQVAFIVRMVLISCGFYSGTLL